MLDLAAQQIVVALDRLLDQSNRFRTPRMALAQCNGRLLVDAAREGQLRFEAAAEARVAHRFYVSGTAGGDGGFVLRMRLKCNCQNCNPTSFKSTKSFE